jgi:hypothetical protein
LSVKGPARPARRHLRDASARRRRRSSTFAIAVIVFSSASSSSPNTRSKAPRCVIVSYDAGRCGRRNGLARHHFHEPVHWRAAHR